MDLLEVNKMKSALIGVGVIGKIHLNILKSINTDIVGVCDIDESKLENIDVNIKYTDYKKMLDETNPDVVHICTPHHLHSEMIIYALNKGINVLCEKPICINENEINEIEKVLKNSKAILGVCYQNRYNPAIIYLKDYLKERKINSIKGYLFWNRNIEYYTKDYWHGKKEYEGGGVLINQAIHTIDLMQYLTEMPETIIGKTFNISLKDIIDVEDTGIIYTKDKSFYLSASVRIDKDYPVNIIIKVEKDIIKIIGNHLLINDKLIKLNELKLDKNAKKIYGGGHSSLISDFYYCIENKIRFEIDFYEAIKSLKIVLKAYQSEGKEININ
jgi:predicted dehydrogenase